MRFPRPRVRSPRARRSVSIINHYAPFPEKDGWSGLHLEMARELQHSTWDVHVVAAGTSHPGGRSAMKGDRPVEEVYSRGARSFWLRVPEYEGNGLARIRNMAVFSLRLLDPRVLRAVPRPDVVTGRVVNPAAAVTSWLMAKALGVPYVLEISDIWPATLVELGKVREGGIVARALGATETVLIRSADAVMSPLPHIDDYLRDRGFGSKPFHWIPNGIAVPEGATPSAGAAPREAGEPFRFMYFGSLGHANAVDTIIHAFAELAQAHGPGAATLEIVGSGPLAEALKDLAEGLGMDGRVVFTGRISRDEVVAYAQRADALVANMRNLDLYRYGVALNKMFDYLLARKPVIFAASAKNNIVRDADAGLTVPGDDAEAIRGAMEAMMAADEDQRRRWAENGAAHVLENYTYKASATRFERMLDEVSEAHHGR